MEKILISACLAGDRVRYDGRQIPVTDTRLCQWKKDGRLVAVCPEVCGGLDIPRRPAQIVNGNGLDVLRGCTDVVDIDGQNVTPCFLNGAERTLSLARQFNIGIAILKEKSPSCGVHQIYDGHFTGNLIAGFGVTAAILRENRIKVFSENELEQVSAILMTG